MKKKMSADKKAIMKIDKITDKALGPKEQLADAAKIRAKTKADSKANLLRTRLKRKKG